MVPSVGITITATSQTNDPLSGKPIGGQYQLTKSFLNIQPRNVLAAIEQVVAGNTSELQPTPSTGTIFTDLQ
jgi:hypothetical protein